MTKNRLHEIIKELRAYKESLDKAIAFIERLPEVRKP